MSTVAAIYADNPIDAEALLGSMQIIVTSAEGITGVTTVADLTDNLGGEFQSLSEKDQPNGYPGLDEDGNILANGVLVRGATASSLAGTVLGVNELAYATDTKEIFASKNTGSSQTGGVRFGTAGHALTPVASTKTAIPNGSNVVAKIADQNVALGDTVFQLPTTTSMTIGDRITMAVMLSTGQTLTGAYLCEFGEADRVYSVVGSGSTEYLGGSGAIYCDAEANAFAEMVFLGNDGSGVPMFQVTFLHNCSLGAA